MIGEDYDTMDIDESEMDYEQDAEYESQDVDDMLDALMDSDSADFAERRRRRRSRRGKRRRGVPAASGRSAYRTPATGGFVTQKQFKEGLDRVAADVKRNGEGIKTVNTRLGVLDGRVDGVVTVATRQSKQLTRLDKMMKVDGALELVESLNGGQLNAFQLLKGAVKFGALGDGTGAMSNPALIGGLGLVLRNPGFLGGLGGGNP